ncbi:MAG: gliding motility-associated C-terminal domain-containing protein [Bacteroidia bacterium]|nr:gliding motility-associated C-terminal domain-containing protein [Bacteroidia bacterium]
MKTSLIKILLFLCLINLPSISKSHSVQVAYCVDCFGNLRIFIEHWHANAAANTTSMTITLVVGTLTTTQTQSPIANIQNVTLANLPGCSTPPISVAGCTGQMNTYNDWVYFDYTGLPTSVPIQFTIISGSNVFTQDGCNMYPLTVSFTIPPATTSMTPISLCMGQLTPPILVPTGVTWTNTNPGIGLPASGTGSIAPFIAMGPASGVITYSNGCGVQSTTITTVPGLTLTPSNNSPFCAGNTLNLTTTAASSYTWIGPNSFTSNLQNPTITGASSLATGAYTVIGMSATGCTASAVTNVTVNALPVPIPTNTGPYCIGSPMQLNGGAFSTFTWTGPNSFSSNLQNPTQSNTQPINAGVYTVAVIDANGCSGTGTTNVIVNPLPIIAVTNPTNCINSTINLTSNGGTTYSWSGPNAFTSNLQNPTIPSAQLNMTGIYTVTVTDVNNCVNTQTASVTVFAIPSPTITSNSPVCFGTTLNLFSSGGVNYSWSGPGYTGTTVNPVIPNVTMGAAGVYTLMAGIGTCTASSTHTVIINPLPTPNIVTNSPVCINFPINFNGSGGVSYSWSGPGLSSTLQNPTIANSSMSNNGNYVLTVTDANGCVDSTNQNVVVNPQPIVSVSGNTVCQNLNVNLGSSGGITYNWTGPVGFTSSNQNPTITNTQLNNAGQYQVIITDANTCSDTLVTTLIVNPLPTPQIVTNSPICIDHLLSLTGSGGVSYLWSGPNGFFSSVQNPTIMANTTGYTGNYNLTVTDINGCVNSTSTAAVVHPIPNVSITSTKDFGCPPFCSDFSFSSSAPIQSYNWSLGNGATGNTSSAQGCYNSTGIYTVNAQVTSIYGCTNSTTHTVEVYPVPVADFNHAPIKPIINIDGEVTFTDASYNATIATWNWYFMNTAQYTSIQQNPTFMYTEPGNYVVALVVKSDHGCIDTVLRPLVVGEDFGIYVPNAFTPNGDGYNDVFHAKGFGIVDYEINIFDRWGEKVFTTKKFEESWDGTFQGRGDKGCKEDTYVWLIRCTSVFGKAHELKGHVTLIR